MLAPPAYVIFVDLLLAFHLHLYMFAPHAYFIFLMVLIACLDLYTLALPAYIILLVVLLAFHLVIHIVILQHELKIVFANFHKPLESGNFTPEDLASNNDIDQLCY